MIDYWICTWKLINQRIWEFIQNPPPPKGYLGCLPLLNRLGIGSYSIGEYVTNSMYFNICVTFNQGYGVELHFNIPVTFNRCYGVKLYFNTQVVFNREVYGVELRVLLRKLWSITVGLILSSESIGPPKKSIHDIIWFVTEWKV